jgi:virulence factor
MTTEKVRVGLIGAGGMANSVHYPSLASFDDVELVGICDLDEKKLAATAEKFGIERSFTDYRAMLEETKPKAVYALMPPHHVFDLAVDVMEGGYDLFIEKPPAVTTFQAENLARAAAKHNVITAVGFQRRYHPLVKRCWEETRKHGDLHQLTVTFVKNQPPQDTYAYYRGAIDLFHCDAIHAVDSLRYYAGLSPVRSVQSVVRNLDCWYASSFIGLVTFENGVAGTVVANWRTGRRLFSFEFHAFNAMSIADADGDGMVWADNKNEPVFASTYTDVVGSDEQFRVQGFREESRAFIDAVKSRKEVHNNLEDAAESMRLADMIIEASV